MSRCFVGLAAIKSERRALNLKATAAIGDLVSLQKQYPERTDDFIAYYESCYQDQQLELVNRALCLEKYVDLQELDESQVESLLGDLPRRLVMLFRSL